MAKWTMCLVLLLLLVEDSDSGETIVKTVWTDSDITPICTNDTMDSINFIICKIRTERNGEECQLGYKDRGFVHNCSSGFRLLAQNQNVSLHLTNLTPEDSGNYTCQCSHADGTYIQHLSLYVKEANKVPWSSSSGILLLVGLTVIIVVTGITLGFIYRRMSNGKPPVLLESSPPDMELDDIEPYSTFAQRESGLYSTVKIQLCNTNAN